MPRRPTPEPVAAKVGARIRDLRQERGMSLAALADESGLSKGHMSSVERGLVLITVGTVVSAAKALGVPPFVLLMFPEEEPLAAVVEHMRSSEGGDTDKAAAALRKLVFGPNGRAPKTATPAKNATKAAPAKAAPAKASTKAAAAPAPAPAAKNRRKR